MDDKHKDLWEEEYARERSNSPNGVLVEICLYGQNDRSTWLVSRISESLSKLSKLGSGLEKGEWTFHASGITDHIDEMMRDLEEQEKAEEGEGAEKNDGL